MTDTTTTPGGAPVRHVIARRDETLAAIVTRATPMRYTGGADAQLDRPAHVRAASGIAWVGARLAVVQDDASFVALVDPATGLASDVVLPAGPGGRRQFDETRGNKADKMDLEALVVIDDGAEPLLVALGSGSSPRRERMLLLRAPGTPRQELRLCDAPALYARLRSRAEFAGSEMNVEGLLYVDGHLRLFARGNGASRDGIGAVDATCELPWPALEAWLARPDDGPPPSPLRVVQYALGTLDGVRLGFTDAVLVQSVDSADGVRRTIYTAAAEESPDATRDGAVAGSALGVIEDVDGRLRARWTTLRDTAGRRFPGKVEGIALIPGSPGRAVVVVDRDDPGQPSDLCEVELRGTWGLAT